MSDPQSHREIQLGGHRYLRVPITASVRLADPATMPPQAMAAYQSQAGQLAMPRSENPDLTWVQLILDTEGANANWDYMPRPALARHFATALYKPFDMEHVVQENGSMVGMDKRCPPVVNTIYGVMTHAALCWADGSVLSDSQVAELDLADDPGRPDDQKLAVTTWAALYSFLFPKTVSAVTEAIARGSMAVSMERWIADWDFLVPQPDGEGFQAVARATAETDGTFHKWAMHQTIGGRPIYRRSNDFLYGGCASTENPANPLSRFVVPNTLKAAASIGSEGAILQVLEVRHREIHERWAVETDEQKKSALSAEHERLTAAYALMSGQLEWSVQ